MVRQFHRNRAELILASVARTILENTEGIQVYTPIANPLDTFSYLIVTDGKGVIYIDHNIEIGPTLACPMLDRQTGKLIVSPFGKFNRRYNAYAHTKAELPKIEGILKLFHEEGWVKLRMGLLKFIPKRHYIFNDFNEFRRWAGKECRPTPYENFVKMRGGDIRNFTTSEEVDEDDEEEVDND